MLLCIAQVAFAGLALSRSNVDEPSPDIDSARMGRPVPQGLHSPRVHHRCHHDEQGDSDHAVTNLSPSSAHLLGCQQRNSSTSFDFLSVHVHAGSRRRLTYEQVFLGDVLCKTEILAHTFDDVVLL